MNPFTKRLDVIAFLLFTLFPFTVSAEWMLDAKTSELTYLSSKMVRDSYKVIFERNHFSQISGSISDNEAVLKINTSSVNTNVPIRDERIMKYIFQSERYPYAVVKLDTDKDFLTRMEPGMFEILEVKGMLTLRDISKPISGKISVVRTGSRLVIQSAEPILVDALDYGLNSGFETLKELAKLFNIPTTIPVHFNLVFMQR